MIEIIPFLLFLMEWRESAPEDINLTRYEVVYSDEASCQEAGRELMAQTQGSQEAQSEQSLDIRRVFSCQPVPPFEEFETMFERKTGGAGE